jgi:glycosyltransferase involved in cell wall biosynthesis
MKIAWLTPLSKRTGVARYSLSVVNALSKIATVDVWTTKHEDNYSLGKDIKVYEITLDEKTYQQLDNYDVIVYNTGNNIAFHCEINELCTKKKGIVIIHDRVLHHYFAHIYLDEIKNPDSYISVMKYWYGSYGLNAAKLSLKTPPPVWETEDVAKYPLFEHLLWNTYGIVVHSKDLLDKVRMISPVPSKHIFHPFYHYPEENISLSREDLKIPDNKIILLQYGHITPNKNVHKVINAISENPEVRDYVYFIVAGDCNTSYGKKIKSLIKEKGLHNTISLTGHVSDSVLHAYIKNADICINLRFPSTEGASGSLIEQLYFKKPVIATRIGFFAEIPDECILKVESPVNISELSNAIKLLINNKEFRKKLALNGSEFARKNFSPDLYAKNFAGFIKDVLSSKTSIDFIDSVSDEILNFVTPETPEYFINNISREISLISGGQNSENERINRAPDSLSKELCNDFQPIKEWGHDSNKLSVSFKDKFISLGWRHRDTIKKIPLLNSISKKVYHSLFQNDR